MTVEEFTSLLEQAVSGSRFSVEYRPNRRATLSASQLRDIYHSSSRLQEDKFAFAKVAAPPDVFESLVERTRALLEEFIDPEGDHVGFYFPVKSMAHTTLEKFVDHIIKAAAVLDARRVTRSLFDWSQGKSIKYRLLGVLSRIRIEHNLELPEGIRIFDLPNSSDQIGSVVPSIIVKEHGQHEILGGTAISIDCEVRPPFDRSYAGSAISPAAQVASGLLAGDGIRTFTESISLACNQVLQVKYSWVDYGDDLRAFGVLRNSYSIMPLIGEPDLLHTVEYFNWKRQPEGRGFQAGVRLAQEHLEKAREIHAKRYPGGEERKEVRIPISRWLKSKLTRGMDGFIDLRIALEGLYCTSDRQLKKQVAERGAKHIAASQDERDSLEEELKRIYKTASDVIHAEDMPWDVEKLELLAKGRDLCRAGILKRLDELVSRDE